MNATTATTAPLESAAPASSPRRRRAVLVSGGLLAAGLVVAGSAIAISAQHTTHPAPGSHSLGAVAGVRAEGKEQVLMNRFDQQADPQLAAPALGAVAGSAATGKEEQLLSRRDAMFGDPAWAPKAR